MVTKIIAKVQLLEQLPDRQRFILTSLKAFCVEFQDIAHHTQKLWAGDVAALGKERVHAGEPVFHTPSTEGCTKAHIALGDGHIKLFE